MTFRQFAFNNVARSFRKYAAFFLSSAFSVMVFFCYAVFIFHPSVETGYMQALARQGMVVAEYIIFIFAFFFVFYSVSTFVKTRKKEFGVLMIHGMSRGQLNRMIFLENMLIGILSIIVGIGVGLIFCKLFLMIGSKALAIEEMPFYLPVKAITLTVISFFLLFLVISFFALFVIRQSQIIELLKGTRKPRPEPKASIMLSLFAALCLIAAYFLAYTATMMTVGLLLIPVTTITIIGTFFLFSQLSVYIINRLKKNQNFYWKKTRLIWLSNLAYRMKDNARMLFLVTIISTVAITATGTLLSFHDSRKAESELFNPYAFQYVSYSTGPVHEARIKQLDSELETGGFDYQKIELELLRDSLDERNLALMKLSDYNHLTQQRKDLQPLELTGNEAISNWYLPNNEPGQENSAVFKLENSGQSFVLKEVLEDIRLFNTYTTVVIITDAEYDQLSAALDRVNMFLYEVDHWEETDSIFYKLFESWTGDTTEDTNEASRFMEDFELISRGALFQEMREATGVMLYVGLFVGLVFFISAGSFLYFRLYSDLEMDQKQYQAVSRIGLTKAELKRSATVQLFILFFVPIVLASLHSAFALSALKSLLNVPIYLSAIKIISCALLVQIVYFLLIRARYLQQIIRIAK